MTNFYYDAQKLSTEYYRMLMKTITDNDDDDNWLLTTPPWSDPAIERLVHVGQEPNRLPHCLLLLGGVHLIDKDKDDIASNGDHQWCPMYEHNNVPSDDHKACLTQLPLHSSPWECNPDYSLSSIWQHLQKHRQKHVTEYNVHLIFTSPNLHWRQLLNCWAGYLTTLGPGARGVKEEQ